MTRRRRATPKSTDNGSDTATAVLDTEPASDNADINPGGEVDVLALAQQIYVKILPPTPYGGMGHTFDHMAAVAFEAAEVFCKAAEERG